MPGIFFYDVTYIFVIVGALLCMVASANVNSTFKRYSKIRNARGITGQEAAMQILQEAGIHDVGIERVSGKLTDHYDPRNKVLRLSEGVYGSTSVAAIGVAAHECGHVVQDQAGYAPIKIRNTIVPVVNLGSRLWWPVILLGLLFSSTGMLSAGIILFSLIIVFQLVTLPVEFNASGRALKILDDRGILYGQELGGARKVLRAAAMTYVASTVSSLLQLLRLFLLFGRRND